MKVNLEAAGEGYKCRVFDKRGKRQGKYFEKQEV